ncbi:hypothetical protein AKJ16_DCAP25743 [Drosera capensis]
MKGARRSSEPNRSNIERYSIIDTQLRSDLRRIASSRFPWPAIKPSLDRQIDDVGLGARKVEIFSAIPPNSSFQIMA